jgi:O-acetyl-ADP-ribose deacetylase (regulator of RNase III)
MKARRVIHTVGPIYHEGSRGEAATLASAYRSSLQVARQEGLRTVAFPSISTGAYRYPLDEAAGVALGVVREELEKHPGSFEEVRFVLFDSRALAAYQGALQQLVK